MTSPPVSELGLVVEPDPVGGDEAGVAVVHGVDGELVALLHQDVPRRVAVGQVELGDVTRRALKLRGKKKQQRNLQHI